MIRRRRYPVAHPTSAGHSQFAFFALLGLICYTIVVAVTVLQRSPEATVRVYVPMASIFAPQDSQTLG